MKNKKLIIILCAVLVVLIGGFGAVWHFTRPETQSGGKQITVTVVHADGKDKEFKISTDAEFLGDAVYEKKLVSKEEHESGFYLTVDDETADYNADKAWWMVTKDGKMTTDGMNEQPIADGDKFEITYSVG